MRIAHHTITWGGVVGHPTGVTSIKDLNYLSHGSIIEAVRDIGAVGYQGTEVFDGNLAAIADDPQPFLDALAASGVELVSVYSGANFVYADVLPGRDGATAQGVRAGTSVRSVPPRRRRRCPPGRGHRRRGLRPARRRSRPGRRPRGRARARGQLPPPPVDDRGVAGRARPADGTHPDRLLPGHRSPRRRGWRPGRADPPLPRAPQARPPQGHRPRDHRDLPAPRGRATWTSTTSCTAVVEAGYDSWLVVELDSTDGDPKDAAAVSHAYLRDLLDRVTS